MIVQTMHWYAMPNYVARPKTSKTIFGQFKYFKAVHRSSCYSASLPHLQTQRSPVPNYFSGPEGRCPAGKILVDHLRETGIPPPDREGGLIGDVIWSILLQSTKTPKGSINSSF